MCVNHEDEEETLFDFSLVKISLISMYKHRVMMQMTTNREKRFKHFSTFLRHLTKITLRF